MPIAVLARNPTDSLLHGLLPALERTGRDVVVLTDHPAEHAAGRPAGGPVRVVGCDVTRVEDVLARLPARCDAVLSNSDHLQTQAALAAAYTGLPGKDWRSAARARDKGLMRARLSEAGLDDTAAHRVRGEEIPAGIAFPAVLKPVNGVASEDVVLVRDPVELRAQVGRIRAHRAGDLLVEALLRGPLHTLETLGDGSSVRVWGGYATTVSPPPEFVEERLSWHPDVPPETVDAVLAQLLALGVGFGPCHTEYVETARGPRLVEVNDRLIGDHCDFAMAEVLGEPVFDQVVGVHLGRPVPAAPARTPRAGLVHWVLAPGDGILRCPVGAGEQPTDPGSRVVYHPIRRDGDRISRTGTNRDYLGSVQVTAPDDAAAECALKAFLAAHQWTVE